jgi:ribosomal protein S18 acetylase RimI-like enzyme
VIDKITLATADDVKSIQRLVNAAYGKYVGRIGKPPAPMLADYAALVAARSVWVLKGNGFVAGVIVLIPQADHLLLDTVAVVPERQGLGLGRRLMIFAEQQAAVHGHDEVRLYTHVTMHENLAVYQKLGYEETGRGEADGYARVFLRKRIGGR